MGFLILHDIPPSSSGQPNNNLNTPPTMKYTTSYTSEINDLNDSIRAQVELEIPRPRGGFASEDEAEQHREEQEMRFMELVSQVG